jgi:hypothetical protein
VAARFYAPLIVLFALVLLIVRPAGVGVGFAAGLALVLAILLHALVFGAVAARAAAPPAIMRLFMAGGLLAAMAPYAPFRLGFSDALVEAGLFLVTSAGGAALVTVLFGRAPTMRDAA